MRLLLIAALLSAAPALAQDAEKQGEYDRVSVQMKKLAARNAWTGVERQYQALVELGLPITADDHFAGAEAARHLGDVVAAQERLKACLAIEEREQALDFLWEIDNNYGKVTLVANKDEALSISETPFQTTQAAAVDFAKTKVAEEQRFEGLLPGGSYTFGDRSFEVVPLGEAVEIDLKAEAEAGKDNGRKPAPATRTPAVEPETTAATDPAPTAAAASREPAPYDPDAPTLVGLAVGAGSPYGLTGIGVGLRVTDAQSLQVGVGFDPLGSAPGWSAAVRQRLGDPALFYVEGGYGSVIYDPDTAPAAGPFLGGGIELAKEGLLVDGTFGLGAAPVDGSWRVQPIFGLALGYNVGPTR